MKKVSRYVVAAIVLASLGSIFYGFSIIDTESVLGNQYIGFGVVGLFLLAMPLFLITESRGKKMKDYMLTDENIRKMREKKENSTSGRRTKSRPFSAKKTALCSADTTAFRRKGTSKDTISSTCREIRPRLCASRISPRCSG